MVRITVDSLKHLSLNIYIQNFILKKPFTKKRRKIMKNKIIMNFIQLKQLQKKVQ